MQEQGCHLACWEVKFWISGILGNFLASKTKTLEGELSTAFLEEKLSSKNYIKEAKFIWPLCILGEEKIGIQNFKLRAY